MEFGVPVVVALNQMDIVKKRGYPSNPRSFPSSSRCRSSRYQHSRATVSKTWSPLPSRRRAGVSSRNRSASLPSSKSPSPRSRISFPASCPTPCIVTTPSSSSSATKTLSRKSAPRSTAMTSFSRPRRSSTTHGMPSSPTSAISTSRASSSASIVARFRVRPFPRRSTACLPTASSRCPSSSWSLRSSTTSPSAPSVATRPTGPTMASSATDGTSTRWPSCQPRVRRKPPSMPRPNLMTRRKPPSAST